LSFRNFERSAAVADAALLAALFSAEALRSSAALPNEKALRKREVLLFLLSFSFKAANCFAAGLLAFAPLATCAYVGLGGCWRAALTADAKESFEAEDSGLMVIGFDKGEGLAILFAASVDEALGGIFTSLGTSCFRAVWSAAKLFVAGEVEDAVGAGFAAAIDTLGSRLLA
jgi:hypothetical protein